MMMAGCCCAACPVCSQLPSTITASLTGTAENYYCCGDPPTDCEVSLSGTAVLTKYCNGEAAGYNGICCNLGTLAQFSGCPDPVSCRTHKLFASVCLGCGVSSQTGEVSWALQITVWASEANEPCEPCSCEQLEIYSRPGNSCDLRANPYCFLTYPAIDLEFSSCQKTGSNPLGTYDCFSAMSVVLT